jgi:hypothetical protein
MHPPIEIEDVQYGIIDTHPENAEILGRECFGSFESDETYARAALGNLLDLLPRQSAIRWTIGFTARGLESLGVPQSMLSVLPVEFVAGARSRAALLVDPPPAGWEDGLGRAEYHFIVMLDTDAQNQGLLETAIAAMTSVIGPLAVIASCARADGLEPFGFRDGISNPVLAGSGVPLTPGNGVPDKTALGGWRSLAAGEIIFGYPNETGGVSGPAITQEILRNGSFLAWRTTHR